MNDTVAVFSQKQFARILLAGGLILTIGGYQFSPRSHAETNETSAAAKPEKVTVTVRSTNARDEERSLTPGEGKTESFQDCVDSACAIKGPEMVVVPAGSFMMGSTPSEIDALNKEYQEYADWYKNEGQQHKVTIATPFAVGKYAVTFAEWDACVADGGCGGYKPSDEGWGRGDRPVINVSWDDTKAYTAWLSKKTGKSYRLLSESEREYVARAGTTTPFWWGTSISTDQADYHGNYVYGDGSKGEYRRKTVPVKSFQPNPWGLYQVHGNVWDWVEDCYHENYNNAPTDGSAWSGEKSCVRVLRGGSWGSVPQGARSAFRFRHTTDFRNYIFGFRVARTIPH